VDAVSGGAWVLAATCGVALALQPEMRWHTIDAGGGTAAGSGAVLLSLTIGQPDVGRATGAGDIALEGGFWAARGTPCPADLNQDGIVDFNDLLEFLNLYNVGSLQADFNGDGIVDFNDFLEYLNLYNVGC